jgi:hypothetical protein
MEIQDVNTAYGVGDPRGGISSVAGRETARPVPIAVYPRDSLW